MSTIQEMAAGQARLNHGLWWPPRSMKAGRKHAAARLIWKAVQA